MARDLCSWRPRGAVLARQEGYPLATVSAGRHLRWLPTSLGSSSLPEWNCSYLGSPFSTLLLEGSEWRVHSTCVAIVEQISRACLIFELRSNRPKPKPTLDY